MKFRNLAYLAAILFISLIAFYSCQKEPNEKLDTEISSKDPKAFSSAIKVWHGIHTQGNPPAQNGNSLQLDNTSSDLLYAIAGRYAIIQPQIVTGNVAGYYLKVSGSSDYFKVDYAKPRNTGRQIKQKHVGAFRLDSAGGNLDSAIVVVLPSNLHVPDTVCMTYWAYDNSGNVSNPVDVCIVISSIGTDTNGAWMDGEWKLTAQWGNNFPHDTVIYNKWYTDPEGDGYYCNNGILAASSLPSSQIFLATDSIFYAKAHITFASNGALRYEYNSSWKILDFPNSNCSTLNFPIENESDTLTGAWSYNSTTHKLILVLEFDDMGMPVEDAFEFDVIQVNTKNSIWVDNSDPSDPFYDRFEKL